MTLLLIVQAFADLSLPRYTSDLVDVGIQQGGIEHASPDEMSATTFNYICMLADDEAEEYLFVLLTNKMPQMMCLTRGIQPRIQAVITPIKAI